MMLCKSLGKLGITSEVFSFPDYTTHTGKLIRQYLAPTTKFNAASWMPEVMHCLQAANKWEHLHDIENAVDAFDVVIMDRYTASNYVYGMVKGASTSLLKNAERDLPKADYTILLDLPVGISFSRNPNNRDKFEQNREFLDEVRNEYLKLAKSKKWKIISADGPKQEIHGRIMDYLKPKTRHLEKSQTVAASNKTSKSGMSGRRVYGVKKQGRSKK